MNTKIVIAFFSFLNGALISAQEIHDHYKKNKTLTYDELIEAYKKLDEAFPNATLKEYGNTDCGKKLQLFTISNSEKPTSDSSIIRILINNGIHPGEPDGIDASLILAEKILYKKLKLSVNICIGIIPVYNIDGMLERGCCSRANQNGPEEYGFRGNTKHLDLNRDFIKADSKNAQSFYRVFHTFKPDLLIDTHVSNGADYQYTMTLLCTQLNKLGKNGNYIRSKFLPELYQLMEKKFPMIPYVNTLNDIPDDGIVDFIESPRFATGYAALFGVIGLTTETHMFKNYPQRVESTLHFLENIIKICDSQQNDLKKLNNVFRFPEVNEKYHRFNWMIDTTVFSWINFSGYEATYPISSITNEKRLKYDRNKPFTKKIKYYNHGIAKDSILVPDYYILPQAWHLVSDRLFQNQIKMEKLKSDQELEVSCYYITSYNTVKKPYEGHYLHYDVETKEEKQKIKFFEGDLIIRLNQANWRYIIETLEPKSEDSFFCWGFFDAILQQKEWYSSYIFEDHAEKMLKENPAFAAEIKSKLEKGELDKKSVLYYIYKHSEFFEKSYNRYPVYRGFN